MPTAPPSRPLPPVQRPTSRAAVGRAAGLDGLHVAVAQVDITPALHHGRVGYGPDQPYACGALGRLTATAMVLDDGLQERVLVLAVDLHGGSRWMTEHLGARLADVGLTSDRIFLAACHVHTGPGPFYGHATYDRIAGTSRLEDWTDHFDLPIAEDILARLERAAREAVAGLRRGRVGYGFAPMWKAIWNRSVDALFWMPNADFDPDVMPPPHGPIERDDAGYHKLIARFNPGTPTPTRDSLTPDAVQEAIVEAPVDLEAALSTDPELAAEVAYYTGLYALATSTTEAPGETLEDALARLVAARRGALGDVAAVPLLLEKWLQLGLIKYKAGKHRGLKEQPGDRGLADNRVHCLYAEGQDGTPLGAICFVGATSTLLGEGHAVYSADAWGYAARKVERAWARRKTPLVVGYAAGVLGDTNLVSPNRFVATQVEAAKTVRGALNNVAEGGAALARATLASIEEARSELLDDVQLRPSLVEAEPKAATVGAGRKLSGFATVGPSMLAASEFAGGVDAIRALGFREGKTRIAVDPYHAADAHYPKLTLPPMEAPPATLGFRSLRLDGTVAGRRRVVVVAGMPAEISTMLGCQIAEDIRAAVIEDTPGAEVLPIVASLVGDYAAYFGTVWEYLAQHYEGASVIYGRWTGEWGRRQALRAVRAAPGAATGLAAFSGGYTRDASRSDPTLKGKPPKLLLEAWGSMGDGLKVNRSGDLLEIWASWPALPGEGAQPLHAGQRTAVFVDGGGPLRCEGLEVDDRRFPVLLWHQPGKPGRWYYRLQLFRPELLRGARVALEIVRPSGVRLVLRESTGAGGIEALSTVDGITVSARVGAVRIERLG